MSLPAHNLPAQLAFEQGLDLGNLLRSQSFVKVVAVVNVSEFPSPYCQMYVLMVLLVSMLVLLNTSVLSHCPVV